MNITIDATIVSHILAMHRTIEYFEEVEGFQNTDDIFEDLKTEKLTPDAFAKYVYFYDKIFEVIINKSYLSMIKPFEVAPIELFNWNIRYKQGQAVHVTIIGIDMISVNHTSMTLKEAFYVLERFDGDTNEYIPFGEI